MKEQMTKLFDDLDNYRKFCVEYGYIFNEAHLYKGDSSWGQYTRWRRGERVNDNWKKDARYEMG
jgi:hypothetical protein